MDTQQRVAASYESAAADFSRFDERLLPGEEGSAIFMWRRERLRKAPGSRRRLPSVTRPCSTWSRSLSGAGLAEQPLMALLHELLYRSLTAENRRRMQTVDSAIRLLERTAREVWQRRNILRQEEIREEIKIVMLSVEAFG